MSWQENELKNKQENKEFNFFYVHSEKYHTVKPSYILLVWTK